MDHEIGPEEAKYRAWVEKAVVEDGLIDIHISRNKSIDATPEEYFKELNHWNSEIDKGNFKLFLKV